MIKRYHLLLLFYYFFQVHAQNKTTLNENNYLGTTERIASAYALIREVYGAHVTYSCEDTTEFSKYVIPFNTLLVHLSSTIKTVTVKDCDSKVQLGEETDIRGNSELNLKNITIDELRIVNVKEFSSGPLLGGLQLFMNGNASIYITDVNKIEIFPTDFISSEPYSDGRPQNKMENLFLSLRNVTIGRVDENTITWENSQIPFTMLWDNVTVEEVSSFAIRSYKFNNNTPIGNFKEYPFNEMYIINSTFGTIPSNAINFAGTEFVFLNNKVNNVTSSAINIKSKDIQICENEFNYVMNFAFSSILRGEGSTLNFSSNKIHSSEQTAIHFGFYDSTSAEESETIFRSNQFKCVNSKWIRYPKGEKNTTLSVNEGISVNYSDILKFEELFYENTDNICFDQEIKCSEDDEEYPALSIKKFHRYYKIFEESWDRYCTNYTIGNYIVYSSIILICVLGIICGIYLGVTTKGKYLYT